MITSVIPPTATVYADGDQARGLRAIVARRMERTRSIPPATRGCHSIVVSGGKGGVGRSVISLNLAIAFAQRGHTVGLLDACPDLGSIELLCGLNGYWNLSHVVQGSRRLDEVILSGPAGVEILSGADCLTDHHPERISKPVRDQLKAFEQKLDWLIVDASGGSSRLARQFASAADDLLIVATPEPTAVAEAYSSIKSVTSSRRPRLGLLINQAESIEQAQQILDHLQHAAHTFLHTDLHRRGYIPRDEYVKISVNERKPFVIASPTSEASREINKLAQRWTKPQTHENVTSFFSRLGCRVTNNDAEAIN